MGGGGAMRAAAKVAGIGVVNGGLRSASAENPVVAAARKASRQVSAVISSSDEVNSAIGKDSQDNVINAGLQRPCWELDDWEFAGAEEEIIVQPREPIPRLVFGGAPTVEEAKEATSELKDALEKVYLSPPNCTGCRESYISGHESTLSFLSKPEYLETKAYVTSENTVASVPTSALQAFKLLNESPAAQNVVASIASDPNVWHAVLQNEALVEYLSSQKSSASDTNPLVKEFVADKEFDHQSHKNVDGTSSLDQSADSGNGFMGFVQNVKTTVVDMVTGLSDYFLNLFGGPTGGKVPAEDAEGSAKNTFVDKTVGASFMGLAVMVVMVVVLKRV